jgi:SPP1 gp7 family putative phage head morphogenesis protein
MAERLYVGGMRRWSRSFRATVLQNILESREPGLYELQQYLQGVRLDAKAPTFFERVKGFGARVLSGFRFAFAKSVETPNLERVGSEVTKHVRNQTKRVLGIDPATFSGGHEVETWRRTNVNLITQMTEEQLGRIYAVLDELGTSPVQVIADRLAKEFGITEQRAELIARDQTLKLNAQITQGAHLAAGITEYIWSTSKDASVRDGHAELEGKRFSYADPPVVDPKTGRTANPGEDYECRCIAVPYLPELEGLDLQ